MMEAATAWARDVGWSPVTTGDLFHSYKVGRSIFSTAVEMEVSAGAVRGGTRVQFLTRARPSPDSSWQKDLESTADNFARGVLSELALEGATVDPSRLATTYRDRSRLKARERFRKWAERVLVVLVIPATVLVWFLSKELFLTLATFLWIFAAIFAVQFSRFRDNGMHARLQVAAVVFIVGGTALLVTIIGALSLAGLVSITISR
jgi:hypothetical protein